MYCENCRAVHPGRRGEAAEGLLYTVMRLDATQKSMYCNPACYEMHKRTMAIEAAKKMTKKQRQQHADALTSHVSDSIRTVRRAWAARRAQLLPKLVASGAVSFDKKTGEVVLDHRSGGGEDEYNFEQDMFSVNSGDLEDAAA